MRMFTLIEARTSLRRPVKTGVPEIVNGDGSKPGTIKSPSNRRFVRFLRRAVFSNSEIQTFIRRRDRLKAAAAYA